MCLNCWKTKGEFSIVNERTTALALEINELWKQAGALGILSRVGFFNLADGDLEDVTYEPDVEIGAVMDSILLTAKLKELSYEERMSAAKIALDLREGRASIPPRIANKNVPLAEWIQHRGY